MIPCRNERGNIEAAVAISLIMVAEECRNPRVRELEQRAREQGVHVATVGAGTAGTMVANKLRPLLRESEWEISMVDQSVEHHYQPGYLFIPFGIYDPQEVIKPKEKFIPKGVNLVMGEIDKVEPEANQVLLADGQVLPYDYLIIATGTTPRPERARTRRRTGPPRTIRYRTAAPHPLRDPGASPGYRPGPGAGETLAPPGRSPPGARAP